MRQLLLLSGQHRTARLNGILGCLLAFNAGAVNAGGFLIVNMYTSHMSGFVAMLADNLILGNVAFALAAAAALVFFACGAATTALLVNAARRHQLRSEYALPLAIEAGLMLIFGMLGGLLVNHKTSFALPVIVPLLAFLMGLQNALMSKASSSLIRTTHMTGVITDLGIEFGKMLYWNRAEVPGRYVAANRSKLRLLGWLLGMFFLGALYGAIGFSHAGFVSILPLAVILLLLAMPPLYDDVRHYGLWQLLMAARPRQRKAMQLVPRDGTSPVRSSSETNPPDANPPQS